MILNRSELISILSSKFKSFTASDIDYSVKKILEHISKSLYSGNRLEVLEHFHYITIILGQQETQKQEN